MSHQSGPCNWQAQICESCCTDALAGLPVEQVEMLKSWAVDYLWRATGKRYGLCERTYRPCRRDCSGYSAFGVYDPFTPYKFGSTWVNLSCNRCADSCGCGGLISEIYLPDTYAVTGLVIDGIEVEDPSEAVVVYDHSRIVKIDGTPWPTCQDLSLPSTEPGTWEITVLTGLPLPAGAELVAGILACELAKACTGDSDCRLPKRVQTITRNGITVGFQDLFDGLTDLRTGLWEVDAFIEASRATRWTDPVIGSPDVPTPVSQTWP